MSAHFALPWLVMGPLLAAIASLLLPVRHRTALAGVFALAQWAATLRLVGTGETAQAVGGWEAPLGIALAVDALAAGMVGLTAVVATLCGVYAARYLRDEAAAQGWFWPLFWFLWAALNVIWLSGDIFNLYVGLELLGLAAVGLVALRGSAEALAAALRYLLAALLGSLAYLLGVALLYGHYGTLSLAGLAAAADGGAASTVALALMAVGLMLKTALFPLYGWLPPAHGGALTPVSALLSALVIKASFYILLRLWWALEPAALPPAATLLGLLGAAAVLWGGWMAWRQHALKQLVAYSTVAQIGYLFLFFPLAAAGGEAAALARDGMLLMLVSHALAKAAMFLSAGNLILASGSERIAELAGINRVRVLALVSFGVAGVSIMGLPPSGGFTAKWLLLQSALAGGQWGWIAVLLGGGLLAALYVFKVFHQAYLDGPDEARFARPSRMLELPALALALASVAVGLFGQATLAWFGAGGA